MKQCQKAGWTLKVDCHGHDVRGSCAQVPDGLLDMYIIRSFQVSSHRNFFSNKTFKWAIPDHFFFIFVFSGLQLTHNNV